MNICIVTPAFPPCYGGVATGVEMRLPGLHAHGLGGGVLTLEYGAASQSELAAGFDVKRLPRLHGYNKWGPLDGGQAFQAVLRYARDADVIHVVNPTSYFSIGGSLATLALRKKLVLETSLIGTDDPVSSAKRRLGFLHNWIFRRANSVIGISSGLNSKARKFGLPASRVIHIPYAVDVDLFRPPEDNAEKNTLRCELGLPLDRLILCYVGFISPRKGVHLIPEAMTELCNKAEIPLAIIIGRAGINREYSEELHNYVEKAKLNDDIQFLGQIESRELLAKYLRASDLFVFPSSREGLGLAPLEAMSCGLCSILTYIPGITDDIAQNGNNAIVIDRTVEDLTNALEMCINNHKLREEVSNKARQTILERYTPEIIAKQYAELYKKITY